MQPSGTSPDLSMFLVAAADGPYKIGIGPGDIVDKTPFKRREVCRAETIRGSGGRPVIVAGRGFTFRHLSFIWPIPNKSGIAKILLNALFLKAGGIATIN